MVTLLVTFWSTLDGDVTGDFWAVGKVHSVVFVTRSVNREENEVAVQLAIDSVNEQQNGCSVVTQWTVVPPVLPFSAEELDEQRGIQGKYVRFQSSDMMNGCFIAILAREVCFQVHINEVLFN